MTVAFRRIAGLGTPRFRVMAGAVDLGTISNPGPSAEGGSWHALAPDGTHFAAASKPKIAEMLQQYARQRRPF